MAFAFSEIKLFSRRCNFSKTILIFLLLFLQRQQIRVDVMWSPSFECFSSKICDVETILRLINKRVF
jgi:hypothetical protein